MKQLAIILLLSQFIAGLFGQNTIPNIEFYKDLNTTPLSSFPTGLGQIGNHQIIVTRENTTGNVWATDGTAAGTVLVEPREIVYNTSASVDKDGDDLYYSVLSLANLNGTDGIEHNHTVWHLNENLENKLLYVSPTSSIEIQI